MKIFLDFDDVLFNTNKFIRDEKSIFKKNKISEEIFKKYYYRYTKGKKGKSVRKYSLKKQLQGIKNELGISTEKIERDLNDFLNNTSKYIFNDVVLFLRQFKKEELFLVSYSKTEFQKNKIKNSRISEYFKKIIITNGKKSEEILKIIKKRKNYKEELFFIDDRADYILDVKKKVSEIKTFLVRRREGRHQNNINKHCDFVVKDLNKVLKIIKK